MQKKIKEWIIKNTVDNHYADNTISLISEELELPKSELVKHIQCLLSGKEIIKVNSKPVCFVDRKSLETKYNCKIQEEVIRDMDVFISKYKKEPQDFKKLIGWDGSLSSLVEQCKATISYPPYGLPMMLHGDTGTGKSLIAKLSYEYAKNHDLLQKEKRFMAVNCSEYANNPELLAANLFGYVKGAFTGADCDTPGLIELADGGVLFLDEVHNLKGECQEKLFQFMDQSTYHRVGDNKTWYTSKIRLIFATTEDPEKVLLKTLLRRIPMTIEVTSLEARGLQEKIQILYHIFNLEQNRLKLKIKMSSQVYNLLISMKYAGNIGGFKSVIQSCCINSLFQINENKEMEITLKSVPSSILGDTRIDKIVKNRVDSFIYVDDLLNITKVNNRSVRLCEEIISEYNIGINDVFCENASKKIFHYLDDIMGQTTYDNTSKFYKDGIYQILQLINKRYHMKLSNNNVLSMSYLFLNFMEEAHLITEWTSHQEKTVYEILNLLKENNIRQTNIAMEIVRYLEDYLDMKLSDMELIVLILFLNANNSSNSFNVRSAVILAHGFSTASSIAEAANQFLGEYVFDSIDMPMNVDTSTVVKQLSTYIENLGNIEELVLLVDMGSLEEIYKGLNIRNTNVGIINQVTTSTALEIGSGILQNKPLEEIFERVAKEHVKYRIENHRKKTPMILCSCMSGMGVARRLMEVIRRSLPVDSKIMVDSYNYNDLLNKGLNGLLFDNYRVVCVVGTMNPHIKGLKFIAIEDLVINSENTYFDEYFKDCMTPQNLELFKKNILINFSLSNLMNTLTILNPNKLLEYVTEALEELQNKMGIQLSNKVSLGLYMHVSCLIERLVLQQKIDVYTDIEDFKTNHSYFIDCVKISFKEIEEFYKVDIPVEEIGYIYDYIASQYEEETDL